MHIGITGSRRGCSQWQSESIRNILDSHQGLYNYAHHGDCIGVDEKFHDYCFMQGLNIVAHPPINDKLRAFCNCSSYRDPLPYLVRNHAIVDVVDLMLACPAEMEEQLRSGTWATIRYAKRIKRALVIIYPDGSQETFNTDVDN